MLAQQQEQEQEQHRGSYEASQVHDNPIYLCKKENTYASETIRVGDPENCNTTEVGTVHVPTSVVPKTASRRQQAALASATETSVTIRLWMCQVAR